MSSAFGLWKVNSSFLTVTRVKVCENALLLLNKMSKSENIYWLYLSISRRYKTVLCYSFNLEDYDNDLSLYALGCWHRESMKL